MIVEGHEPDQWKVYYSAEGEPELAKAFTGHSVTVDNLVLGKPYTFRMELINGASQSVAGGQNTVSFTPIQVINAENLSIVSYADGALTVQWSTSAETLPEFWQVRCYGTGYDESQQTDSTLAVFEGISPDNAYTVEVWAKGMSQAARVNVSANPITLTEFKVDDSNPLELKLTWKYQDTAPENGCMVMYTLDRSDLPSVVKAEDRTAIVAPRIPGAVYHFTLQADGDATIFNGSLDYTCPAAKSYSRDQNASNPITCRLLITPEDENWNYTAIADGSTNQSFPAGQPLSAVLQSQYGNFLDYEDINILYVFRDTAKGTSAELIGEEVINWHDLWNESASNYAELNIPVAPTKPGSYVLDIYFNGMSAASANLTIY